MKVMSGTFIAAVVLSPTSNNMAVVHQRVDGLVLHESAQACVSNTVSEVATQAAVLDARCLTLYRVDLFEGGLCQGPWMDGGLVG